LATKMLASTVQFSKNGRPQPPPQTHPPGQFLEKLVRTAANPQPPPQRRRSGVTGHQGASAPSGPNSAPHETTHHQTGPFHPPPSEDRTGVLATKPSRKQPLEVRVPRQ
jgi:hypothetical protein